MKKLITIFLLLIAIYGNSQTNYTLNLLYKEQEKQAFIGIAILVGTFGAQYVIQDNRTRNVVLGTALTLGITINLTFERRKKNIKRKYRFD